MRCALLVLQLPLFVTFCRIRVLLRCQQNNHAETTFLEGDAYFVPEMSDPE